MVLEKALCPPSGMEFASDTRSVMFDKRASLMKSLTMEIKGRLTAGLTAVSLLKSSGKVVLRFGP